MHLICMCLTVNQKCKKALIYYFSLSISGARLQETMSKEEQQRSHSHWDGVKLPLGALALVYITYRQLGVIDQREKRKIINATSPSDVTASSVQVC